MAERHVRTLTCAEADDMAAGFVLGALEPDEWLALREHLATCQNEHPDFALLGSVRPALLETVEPVEPRAELGHRIMAAAGAEPAGRAERSARAQPKRQQRAADPSVKLPLSVPARRPYVWMAIAAALAIFGVIVSAWNADLRGQLDQVSDYRNATIAVIDMAADGGQLVVLQDQAAAADSHPAGIGAVAVDGRVAVAMRDLGPTSGDQVYEVWMIGSDGAPRPVGNFTVAASGPARGLGSVITAPGAVEPGVTVALTLEPRPGMTAPTLPIIAAGVAAPPG